MRTIFAFGFAVMVVTPAFATRALCDRIGNDCQSYYNRCLRDEQAMGANCRNGLADAKATGHWHLKAQNMDCACK
jgi:hypothetical protein